MSKVSTTDYPTYTGGSIDFGGSRAKTGYKNGSLVSKYTMSENEAAIYNYALSTLADILPEINTFDAGTMSSLQSQVDAYKNMGLNTINKTYEPLLSELKTDIASRFGNFDNSIFEDNLNDIESKRADAVSAFAQDVLAKQSALESDELTKRYALIELLTGVSNNTYNNALSAINAALGNSANVNNYNSNLYKALSSMSDTTSSNKALSALSSLLSAAGGSLFGL